MCIINPFIALFSGDKVVSDTCTEPLDMLIFVCIISQTATHTDTPHYSTTECDYIFLAKLKKTHSCTRFNYYNELLILFSTLSPVAYEHI